MAPRNCDLTWVDASNGHIPTGAIQVVLNVMYMWCIFNVMYIIIFIITGIIQVVVIIKSRHIPNMKKFFFPYITEKTYRSNWDISWPEQICCFQGGFNEENDPIYIGRAHHEDSYAVGKVLSFVLQSVFWPFSAVHFQMSPQIAHHAMRTNMLLGRSPLLLCAITLRK